ncbi:hypothetical protein [Enterocloster bolteae]|jgi:hypothetical protein|nr:hypothetical protein [Enterocloster bolteae]RGO77070.1 hypothetical protein DXB04_28810 [Enterocloster bolteae]
MSNMTDLERFEDALVTVGIEYNKRIFQPKNFPKVIELDINEKYIYMSYSNSVSIRFDEDGKFTCFEAFGE